MWPGIRAGGSGRCVRDLDNLEYEPAPDQILIPRFFGQGDGFTSDLVLIGLTGRDFTTHLEISIYNDDEEVFSSELAFDCWQRTSLLEISGVFANGYLRSFTTHAPGEILGAEERGSGWIRLDGAVASSEVESVADPAFLALLIERTPEGGAVADLPWEFCTQVNGAVLRAGLSAVPRRTFR